MNQAGNTPAAGKPTTEIEAGMNGIDAEISEIIRKLHALDIRIDAVMSPPVQVAKADELSPKSMSLFGQALEHYVRRLHQANDSLDDILDRIHL